MECLKDYGEKCHLCYQLTSLGISPPSSPKPALIRHVTTYLYHENLKEALLPSTVKNTNSVTEDPKLTFTISVGSSLNPRNSTEVLEAPISPPIILCGECTGHLKRLDELHQQLESVKKSIDLQMKLINRKRIHQESVQGTENLNFSRAIRNVPVVTPGFSVGCASIGKENISRALTFLNSICEGISSLEPSLPTPVSNSISAEANKNDNGNSSSTLFRTKIPESEPVMFDEGQPVVGGIADDVELGKTTFVKVEDNTCDYLEEMQMQDNFKDSSDTIIIQPNAYHCTTDTWDTSPIDSLKVPNDPPPDPLALNEDISGECSGTQANEVGVEKKRKKRVRDQSKKQCPECNKMINRHNFAHHRRLHTGETPHVCEFCNQGFVQKTSLIRHLVVHTGERNHECEICGKGFILKFDVKRHRRVVHKIFDEPTERQ